MLNGQTPTSLADTARRKSHTASKRSKSQSASLSVVDVVVAVAARQTRGATPPSLLWEVAAILAPI